MRTLASLTLFVLAASLSAQTRATAREPGSSHSNNAAASPESAAILEQYHEFDQGSRIVLTRLSAMQIDNLVTLGRVWGFLKYHHPAVTAGERQWDYDLLRVTPRILAAKTPEQADAALVRWIDGLGPVTPCKVCARLDTKNLEFGPDLEWITDTKTLGEELSDRLQTIYTNRPTTTQFYVSLVPGVLNPSFDHEPSYSNVRFPDAGFQLLGLYRFWNILQYWSPNRYIAGEDWPAVLREFIPRVTLAKSKDDYELVMLAFVAKVNDTHANLWGSMKVRPPVGDCRLPANVRFVEGKLVVTSVASKVPGAGSGLKTGDVIDEIDGHSVEELTKQWGPLYADSNEAARLRDVAQSITKGACGPARLSLDRAEDAALDPARVPAAGLGPVSHTSDLPGPTFRLLSKDVAYLKLSSIKAADVPKYIEQAGGTKGLIIDIRNYPSEFVVYALGSLLVDHEVSFARFTNADLANPGAFYWGATASLAPAMSTPHFRGKIVILVDEMSQSQAEYTTMAFRTAPNAVVVGSTTAGADGNVSQIVLPGGLRTAISGIGVFYPDKTPTQRVGIIPDVEVRPTIAGIRAGRDEVLEVGIQQIVGKDVPIPVIDRLIAQ